MRSFLVALLFFVVSAVQAQAQSGPEDMTRSCPLVTPELVKVAAASIMGRCPAFCSGCGCKGGPGYRAPESNGRKGGCVGYADIISKCGPAPHKEKGCVRECARVVVACVAFGRTKFKEAAKAANINIEFAPSEVPDDGPELAEEIGPALPPSPTPADKSAVTAPQ
jgi:hypothetical protein